MKERNHLNVNFVSNKHIKTVHEDKKNFNCDICEKRFSQKDVMNRHISSVHEKNKPHK